MRRAAPATRPLPYDRADPTTHAFGRFAVLAALEHRPRAVRLVLVHSELPVSWRTRLEEAAARSGTEFRQDDATVARLRRHGQVLCLALVGKEQDRVEARRTHVVLLGPSHAGNVGSALRSLVAFGLRDVVLIRPQVDAWGPHVVRASVGMRFALRCEEFVSPEEYVAEHPDRRHYVFSAAADTELREVRFEEPASLWFGPEWVEGGIERVPLPPATSVRIDMDPQVESLNLSTAVSLVAYIARGGVSSRGLA